MLGPRSSRLIQILKDSSSTTLATASHFPSGKRAGNPKYMPGQSGSTRCALPSRVTHTSSCSPCPVPVAYTSDPVADTARSAEPPEPNRIPPVSAVGAPLSLTEFSLQGKAHIVFLGLGNYGGALPTRRARVSSSRNLLHMACKNNCNVRSF